MPQCFQEAAKRLRNGLVEAGLQALSAIGEVTGVSGLFRSARGTDEGGEPLSAARRVGEGALAVAGMVPLGGGGTGVRALRAADIGVDGLRTFDATLTLEGSTATVAVNMVEGETSATSVISALKALAQDQGATTLRIQGRIANERLYSTLVKRYGLRTEGGVDVIEIQLK